MRTTVKICGLTSPSDAGAAVEAGADVLGFVFFPASRRCLEPTAAEWIAEVRGAATVGVFRDQDDSLVRSVRETGDLDMVQLHGRESPELCAALGGRRRVIKAIHVSGAVDWAEVAAYAPVARILFDTASPTGGGTGRTFDWTVLADRPSGLEFWLAGGLSPDNVAEAVRTLRPAGVDVASGVESRVGHKDADRMRRLVKAVHEVDEEVR